MQIKKKVWFAENVEKPTEAGVLYTIDGQTFHVFTMTTWIGNSGISYHITNDDTSLNDITKINESVQGSLGNMLATQKSKLCIKVHQVNGSKGLHVLWFIKFCIKTGANLYSIRCKALQENAITSDHQNNIVIHSSKCTILFDQWIKTHDGWAGRVEFHWVLATKELS